MNYLLSPSTIYCEDMSPKTSLTNAQYPGPKMSRAVKIFSTGSLYQVFMGEEKYSKGWWKCF